MVRLNCLASTFACALILLATPTAAQSNSAHRSTDVVAGKQHRLGAYGNVQKDCTPGPLPSIRIVTPPKHGELNVRTGKLKAGRVSRCPNLEPTALGVFYKANSTYKGVDQVSYEVKSASGKVESHTVRITVKDAPAAGAHAAADADTDL